jgi:hypothetical protein|tara:strand:+ start:1496 stop:2683 length:1188 start_codon:yes stop_codon:yes gene_type:complete
MDNTYFNNEFENSTEDSESESEDNIDDNNGCFLNMVERKEYEKNRNKLFTKDIIKKKIVIDSHNYYQGNSNFNTSDFNVVFDYEKKSNTNDSSLVTTNYDIYNDVIGFRMLKTTIRTPPYNVNKTNNIIRYKSSRTGDTVHTVTITPGQYDIAELRDVFQKFEANQLSGAVVTNIDRKYTQYVTYSDSRVYTDSNKTAVSTPSQTFTLTFYSSNVTNMLLPINNKGDDIKGLKFRFSYNGKTDTDPTKETVTVLWDYDNITRGAARLFGFIPKATSTIYNDNSNVTNSEMFSNRLLDISTHYADLVIPEIPSIACKRNSSGREIVERIQMKAGHGEYLHFRTNYDEADQDYFNPIKLHRLNIQLWSGNNELYDTNNSDVSFEFEITMLKNKRLLM